LYLPGAFSGWAIFPTDDLHAPPVLRDVRLLPHCIPRVVLWLPYKPIERVEELWDQYVFMCVGAVAGVLAAGRVIEEVCFLAEQSATFVCFCREKRYVTSAYALWWSSMGPIAAE